MAEVKERKGETVPVSTGAKEVQTGISNRSLAPFEEMDRFMDRLMDGLFSRRWLRPLRSEMGVWPELEARMPSIDVVDRDEDILIRAEIPGVEKKDLDVSVSDHTVTIRGQSQHESKQEKGDYFRAEISRGSFSRTINLPHMVDGSKAIATCKDGMLELTLPKIERARKHTVKVQ